MKKFDVILKCNGMTIINRKPWKKANTAGLINALIKQREKFWQQPQKMLRLVAGGLWKPLNTDVANEKGAFVINIGATSANVYVVE